MYRIAYLSMAHAGISNVEIGEILEVARRNNNRDGVTGMLLFKDGMFLQILEGEEHKVRACYDRISGDPRHTEVERVYQKNAESAAFSNWSMAFARPRDLPQQLAPAARELHEVAQRLQDEDISGMTLEVRTVARLMRRFLDDWRADDEAGSAKLFATA